jgi:ribonuclease HI
MEINKILRCYVDSSWSQDSRDPSLVGWGVFFEDGTKFSGTVLHKGSLLRAGKYEAILTAIAYAIKNGAKKLVIFYDDQLPEEQSSSQQKTGSPANTYYELAFTEKLSNYNVELRFVKVKADMNRADALAASAIGIKPVR